MKKQNAVLRLTERIYSSPQLITKESFAEIEKYLDDRNSGILLYDEYEDDTEPRKPDTFYDRQEKIGVLNIKGSLTAKPLYTICGKVGTSYSELLDQTEEMLNAGVKTIIMNVSSGGGEAYSAFSSVDQFRKMVEEAGAKVYGYADSIAASAAYAWICSCDEVYAHADTETGSIGVLIGLLDTSEYMKKEGLKRVWVTAGEDKIPFAEDGSFKQEFLDDLKYKIDIMYENFVGHVSKYRAMTPDEVKATKAKTFMSKDALALGLIDGIKTEREFQDYVISKHKGM